MLLSSVSVRGCGCVFLEHEQTTVDVPYFLFRVREYEGTPAVRT